MSEEMNNKIRLNQARRNELKDSKGQSKNDKYGTKLDKITSPVAAAKKTKDIVTAPTEIQATDFAIYGIAFSLAALKDLLDLAIGIIPGVVTVIGFCISIAIGFTLLFDGISSSQRKAARIKARMIRRYLVLIAGTMVESFLVGLNYFPFELLTVAIIYWMSLVDRKAGRG